MKAKRSIGTIAIAAVLAAFVVLIGLQTASSQEVKKTYPSKPDVKYKVNKEYDEQGNIIRFDSTYSYSWSSIDSMHVDVDSIFKQFNQNSFFDLGSMLNHNRNWANNGDSLNTNPYQDFNRQFEEFFNFKSSPTDSSFFEYNPYDFFGGDFQEIIKDQQQRMDKLLQQFYFNQDSTIYTPKLKTPTNPSQKNEIEGEKQNYQFQKNKENTVNV